MRVANELIQFITPQGDVINLHTPPTRAVQNMTGWGRPPMNMRTITSAYQHGESVISYRLNPRTIQMTLAYPGCSRSDWFNNRGQLLNRLGNVHMEPNLPVLGTLRWEYLKDGQKVTRDLDCYLSKGLEYNNEPQWYNFGIIEDLEFIASDPIIYDPEEQTATLTIFTESLILPMAFPFVLGASYASSDITYTGTWFTYPVIEIDGPTDGVRIVNESIDAELNLDYSIATGRTVTIDTSFNEKSVTDDLDNNLIQYLVFSDFAEFVIAPDPFVAGGVNTIKAYVYNESDDTEVRVKYYTRYYGI
jgi:hypothetical protein